MFVVESVVSEVLKGVGDNFKISNVVCWSDSQVNLTCRSGAPHLYFFQLPITYRKESDWITQAMLLIR